MGFGDCFERACRRWDSGVRRLAPSLWIPSKRRTQLYRDPTGEIYEEYTFDSNLDPIVAQAKIEHRGKWKDGGYGGTKPGMRRIRTHAFVGKGIGITFTGRTPTTGSDPGHVPDGKTGIVRVIRRANVVDRMREWFFRRKWKGARP